MQSLLEPLAGSYIRLLTDMDENDPFDFTRSLHPPTIYLSS